MRLFLLPFGFKTRIRNLRVDKKLNQGFKAL